MEKPYEYTVRCLKTGNFYETNICPLKHELETYEETGNENIRVLKQTKAVYVDTRYRAKLRLYNYVEFKVKGLEVPRYSPYKNTEIGKSIPILNF